MIFYFLPPVLLTAVFFDLIKRKIPNPLIICGLIIGAAYQWSANGPPGLVRFLGGMLIPFLLLGILHYFRMLGAGDIKLLMVAGGFFGPAKSIACIVLSFVIAAVLSIIKMLKYPVLGRRLRYLLQYLANCRENRKWTPYLTGEEKEAGLHFSGPVCLAAILLLATA